MKDEHKTAKPILAALINASESFADKAKPELPKSLGRNGYIKTTGLVVELTHGGREVLIAPLTSRKTEARCYVSMPATAIESLVRALTQISGRGYSIVSWPKAEGSANEFELEGSEA